jgi:hypothetical protein
MQYIKTALAAAALALAGTAAQASTVYTYVGSFNVFDGAVWTSNPQVMNGVEAAASLFGGSASDYAISVDANTTDATTITHTAWLDGWGDTQYLTTAASETYSLSSIGGGYNQYPAFSAYVCDHANCQAYGFSVSTGEAGLNYTNYVWRAAAVPEPATLGLMLAGLGMFAVVRRRSAR